MSIAKQAFSIGQSIMGMMTRSRGFVDCFEPKGRYHRIEHYRNGKLFDVYAINNGITNQGKNYLFDAGFNSATQITSTGWFISLIDSTGYSALANGDTMASKGWTEFVGYSQTSRVLWGQGTSSGQTVTNGTPATFDISAAGTLKGIFIIGGTPTKGATTGTLWSTGLFTSDVPVSISDQFKLSYALSA